MFALIRDQEASFHKVFSGSCEEVTRQTIEAAATCSFGN